MNLNEYFLYGGTHSAVQTDNNETEEVVVPESGVLVAVVIHISAVINVTDDADHTFDVMVSGADSGEDALLPDASPANAGVRMNLTAPVDVVVGQSLSLKSNGDQIDACTGLVSWVIRR